MSNEEQFRPTSAFTWETNRSERSRQVRWLAPLLERPIGRRWFLKKLGCSCPNSEVQMAEPFHLCFPLRDIFTYAYYQCRGNSSLEDQFIAFYNDLFDLPEDFGIKTIWKTAPGGEIRHPAAVGRAGWYEEFLQKRIHDRTLYKRARDLRRMLGTEADLLLLTKSYVVLVECKFKSSPSLEKYKRQLMMGSTLANRLDKSFHFGMVVEKERDSIFAKIQVPYVLWADLGAQLSQMKATDN